ncbi:MAG TPA: hypothetical protein VFB78_12950 [Acidimicrobiales bacterium]|nr:hypothetical protein [Acidimicrobiales bacterium]
MDKTRVAVEPTYDEALKALVDRSGESVVAEPAANPNQHQLLRITDKT